jgi:predicted AlkP superfamily pyrophosphatase or phosphodiesterase
MRRLAALSIALVLCGTGARGTAQPVAPTQHVVLISIDGFAAFHLDDPAIDLPNIRALAAAGVRARSESVFPSMTHPSHTTLITGVTPRDHGVVNNRVVDRRTGQRFHITNLPRRESIKVATIFDAVAASGRRTAAFFWPETRDDAAIADNIAEVFDGNGAADGGAVPPGLLDELRRAGVPIDSFAPFYDNPFSQPAADIAMSQAAAHVLKVRKPALLALHLLAADKAQHDVGADHYLSRAALSAADYCVGLLRQAVADAGLADRTTFVIVADHGFVTVREQVDLASVLDEPALAGKVRWQASNHWYVWGELLPGFVAERDGAALERVLARAASTDGVARIVRPGEFAALGYPEYADNPYVPGSYLIAGRIDTALALESARGSSRRRPLDEPYHGHGYFPDHPSMHASLVLSGGGVARGARLDGVRNVDVAPTIASLLGVSLPGATGRVLIEALRR